MLGWIAALVVLLLAALLLWRLRGQLAQSREDVEELRVALHREQEALDQRSGEAVLGRLLADLGADLAPPPQPTALPAEASAALLAYAEKVQDFDAAVQNCLRPVELMPGADEDDLDKLMEHVANARRRLFDTRARLVDDRSLQDVPAQLQARAEEGASHPHADLLRALAVLATASHDNAGIGLDRLLPAVLALTRARHRDGATLQAQWDALPTQPVGGWLAPCLLHLLHLGLQGARDDQPAQLVLHERGEQRVLSFQASPAEVEADAALEALHDLRARLATSGVDLQLEEDPRRFGFELMLGRPADAGEP